MINDKIIKFEKSESIFDKYNEDTIEYLMLMLEQDIKKSGLNDLINDSVNGMALKLVLIKYYK